MSDNKLRILLLGTPMIMLGEKPVRIQRRLTRALMYYLAFNEQAVSRSELILLFWPDASEQDGRRRLREILSKLRSELPEPGLLIAEQESISLDLALVTVDARDFIQKIEEVRKVLSLSSNGRMLAFTYQQASQAALLWRSNRFMTGFELPECEGFQDWLSESERSLQFQRMDLLTRLADHHLVAAEPAQAIHWLRSAIEIDELDSELHLRLLRAYRDLGRYGDAITHCERLEELYEREGMGSLPHPITKLCLELHEGATKPKTLRPVHWPIPLEVYSPFVGREQFTDQLNKHYTLGGAVVILGEAGAGKSRLIYESCQTFQTSSRLLITGGREMESDMPLQPWIDLLRREVKTDEWDQLDPHWLALIQILIPELRHRNEDLNHLEATDPMQRGQLFEAIRQILLILGKTNKIVFVLDDAQWVDPATYSLLIYLMERDLFRKDHLLLIASRLEESNSALDKFIERQNRNMPLSVYTLDELKTEHILLLAETILGVKPEIAFIQRLSIDTGGNPLVILGTLREILDHNIDPSSASALRSFPIPGNIRALVYKRMNTYDSDMRKVIFHAAVMGMEISSVILEHATGMRSERMIEILEKLEQHHGIRSYSGPNVLYDYTFIHNAVREILISSMSKARQRLTHLKVAQALEQEPGFADSNPSILALHFEHAIRPMQSFQYWLKTGQHAFRLLSTAEATQAFLHAENQLQRIESLLTDRQIYELYTSWGEMSLDIGDLPTKQNCFQNILEHGRRRNSPLLVGVALSGMSNYYVHKVDPVAGLAAIREAIPHLKRSKDDYELIMAYNRQAMCQQLLHDMDGAVQSYKLVGKLGTHTSDRRIMDARTISLSNESLLHIFLGFPEKALQVASQAISLSQVTGNLANQCRALVTSSTSLEMMSDIPASLESALTGISLCERIQAPHISCYLQLRAAMSEFRLGYIDRAWQRCDFTSDLAKDRFLEVLAEEQHVRGLFYLRFGMLPDALASFQAGMSLQKDTLQFTINARSMAFAMGLAGKTEESLQILNEMIKNVGDKQLGYLKFPSLIDKAGILVQLARNDEARSILLQVKAECVDRKYWEHVISCNSILGKVELASGNKKIAQKYGESVIKYATHHQHIWRELDALLLEKACLPVADPRLAENRRRRLVNLDTLKKNCQLPLFQPALDKLVSSYEI